MYFMYILKILDVLRFKIDRVLRLESGSKRLGSYSSPYRFQAIAGVSRPVGRCLVTLNWSFKLYIVQTSGILSQVTGHCQSLPSCRFRSIVSFRFYVEAASLRLLLFRVFFGSSCSLKCVNLRVSLFKHVNLKARPILRPRYVASAYVRTYNTTHT